MLTLDDLRELCCIYVPVRSLHLGAQEYLRGEMIGGDWWPAHELGHLLTVPRSWIGRPMMGITDIECSASLCLECAAMSVSTRLLEACGRADLVHEEISEASRLARMHDDDPRVHEILRKRRAVRIPTSRGALEIKLRAATGRASRVGQGLGDLL